MADPHGEMEILSAFRLGRKRGAQTKMIPVTLTFHKELQNVTHVVTVTVTMSDKDFESLNQALSGSNRVPSGVDQVMTDIGPRWELAKLITNIKKKSYELR